LSTWQRRAVVAAITLAFFATGQKLLILIGLVALFRAFQATPATADSRTLVTFIGLVGALSWLAHAVG